MTVLAFLSSLLSMCYVNRPFLARTNRETAENLQNLISKR